MLAHQVFGRRNLRLFLTTLLALLYLGRRTSQYRQHQPARSGSQFNLRFQKKSAQILS